MASRQEVLDADNPVDKAIGEDRDRKVIETLEELLAEAHDQRRIGVVWGASHMPAVARYLLQEKGYAVGHAEWLDVM